jgi:hypothetical protein
MVDMTVEKILCYQCTRRKGICDEQHKPTEFDAYRCKYDEAQRLMEQVEKSFDKGGNE